MPSELTVYPSSDLTGAHRLTLPFAIDATNYKEPAVESFAAAGYQLEDGAAVQDVAGMFVLPAIAASGTQISVGSYAELPYNSGTQNIGTSWVFPLPASRTNGQLLELYTMSQETQALDRGVPQQTAGPTVTNRWSHVAAADFSPRLSKFWRIIDGTEGSTITMDFGGLQSRLFGFIVLWNGVNQVQPYDTDAISSTALATFANPDPPSIITRTPGAAVLAVMGGDRSGGAATTQPVTYSKDVDQSANDRMMVLGHKTIAVAGYENPGAFASNVANSTSITDVLRPAGSSATVLLAAGVTDDSETAQIGAGDAPEIGARNEVQQVASTLTSGTFTLTYDGQTTAAIDFDATAAEIETALEGLSNLAAADVSVTGSSIDAAPVEVEFTGALAETNVPLMSSSSTSVIVVELVVGSAAEGFTYRGDLNIPRVGGSYSPQVHFWTLDTDDYLPGKAVDVRVSSVASGLKSWVGVLLVLSNTLAATPIVVSGAEKTGTAKQSDFGSITPGVNGSKALAWVLKALPGASDYYTGAADNASIPPGFSSAGAAAGAAMTLDAFISPPLPDSASAAGVSSWTRDHLFVTGQVEVRAAAGLTALGSLAAAVDTPGADSWIEIAQAAGNMYEVLEVDLGPIPSDAVITGARIEVDHESSVRDSLRIALAGINTDGSFAVAQEDASGYVPEPLGERQTSTTTVQRTFLNGETIDTFDRLGVVLRSTAAAPGLSSHRIHNVRMVVEYEEGGPVVSSVVGPDNAGETITWAFSSSGAFEQIGYEVMVIAGSSQDPATATTAADPLTPATGEIVYSSGVIYDPDARSLSITDAPLARGAMTVAVRALAQLPSGIEVRSDWGTDNFDISGTGPSAPASASSAFNTVRGTVDVSVTAPSGATRGWLLRSTDSGATWKITESSPFTVAPGAVTLADDRQPFQKTRVDYAVSFDAGPMSETSAPVSAGNVSTVHGQAWYLMAPGDPARNLKIDVVRSRRRRRRRSVEMSQPGASVIGLSPDLGWSHELVIRYRTQAGRLALDALLETGDSLRLVDVIGRSWIVAQIDEIPETLYRAQALETETTALRDMGEITVSLTEVGT